MSAPAPSNNAGPADHVMDAKRRQELVEALLAALRHTVGRDEHLPFFLELVDSRAGPATFSQLTIAAGGLDVSRRSEE
jgi:hypothetical protein